MLRITLVLFIVGEAVAGNGHRALCPYLNNVEYFKVAQYMGMWYKYATYDNIVQKIVSKCSTVDHKLSENDSFQITNTSISIETNKASTSIWIATPIGGSRYGKFTLRVQSGSKDSFVPYEVLATDYVNYALVRSCINSAETRFQVLTRVRKPSKTVRDQVKIAMGNNGLGKIVLTPTDQKNCRKSS